MTTSQYRASETTKDYGEKLIWLRQRIYNYYLPRPRRITAEQLKLLWLEFGGWDCSDEWVASKFIRYFDIVEL